MVTHGLIAWKGIKQMLDACAAGWHDEEKEHKRWVYFGSKPPFKLPLGPHGKRQNPGIQVGHVRAMIRHFEIIDCAKRELEQLR